MANSPVLLPPPVAAPPTPPPIPGGPSSIATVTPQADPVQPIIIQMPSQDGGVDWAELILGVMTLLGALAWPVLFGIAIWVFRDAIKAKLADAESIDILGFKLIMRRVAREAGRIAANVDALEATGLTTGKSTLGRPKLAVKPAAATHAHSATSPGPVPRPFQMSEDHEAVFARLVNVDPRAAISYQWNLIEEKVAALARAYGYGAGESAVTQADDLISLGAFMGPEVRAVLHDLRRARDSAIHVSQGFSREDAINYREAALVVMRSLDWQIAQATS